MQTALGAMPLLAAVLIAFSTLAAPEVTAPPEPFFELVDEEDRAVAREFYKKFIDVNGMPVVAAGEVANQALQRTHEIVTNMLAGRPDITKALVDSGMYLIIIGKDQVYTDMPEYRNARNSDYMNERVRGTGGRPTSFGEENLLSLPIDRYDDESIGVHEFSHTIDRTLRGIDNTWREALRETYRAAMDKGLYKYAYAAGNSGEYWAEIVQSYFDCNRVNNWNHGPVGTREQLKTYDPLGYELVRRIFNLNPDQDWRYSWLQPLLNVIPPPSKFGINSYYTKFSFAREFPVVGRDASDEAMLKANDTIRKLFAYRHDILKAFINEGGKLVVLGRNERIADLPEYDLLKKAESFDPLARFHDYSLDAKTFIVAEENILRNPASPMVGDDQVITVFARAIHQVTARRPEDHEWGNRRDVQQYELRVQRIDERFEERIDSLFKKAMNEGRWRGTASVHGPINYWTKGVLAYFHALGQDASPNDAPHPITTRDLLNNYDQDLHEFVNETMAYDGHVDWHFKPATTDSP